MKRTTKILIVDDEPQNTQIMREILSFHPRYDYRIAMSGEEALKILKSYYPDIVLLDIMMPGMDGYEVCRKIRSLQGHRFSKVIMISGMSMIGDRLKGYMAGADDYITKPFVEDELLAKFEVFSKLNRMEEVDSLKTMALNILSHETRTPLNGILLGCELLKDMSELSETSRRYVSMVKESGVRIQELVEKISRYCSIKDGISLNVAKESFNNIIATVSEKQCSETMIDVQYHFDENFCVFVDKDMFSEALFYVVDNACKNSPESGVVKVLAGKKNGMTTIQVIDQGDGVDPSLTERIFEGLFSKDILHHKQGVGLSLAIAKEIIEEHGGSIICRNDDVEQGAVFEITLQDSIDHI